MFQELVDIFQNVFSLPRNVRDGRVSQSTQVHHSIVDHNLRHARVGRTQACNFRNGRHCMLCSCCSMFAAQVLSWSCNAMGLIRIARDPSSPTTINKDCTSYGRVNRLKFAPVIRPQNGRARHSKGHRAVLRTTLKSSARS